jgi:N-acetyl-anhydromuramyl-L-alanine amidase AmpD
VIAVGGVLLEQVKVLDWRSLQANPPALVRGVRKHKIVSRREGGKIVRTVFERDMTKVDGIVLHQTACTFGPSDNELRRHQRAFGVACHALAFRDMTVVLPNPLPWLVWHGNGFNDRSLGIEAEGRLAGRADDPSTAPREDLESTWGGPPDDVTEQLVAATRRAVRELCERTFAEHRVTLKYIWAHRQSSGTRRSDPGEELWKRVVLEYAVPVLGLKCEPKLVLPSKGGSGRPIPKQWDLENGVGRY